MKLIKMKIINKRGEVDYKILEVSVNMTLYKFAEIIVKRFGFYFDHAFGFYFKFLIPKSNREMIDEEIINVLLLVRLQICNAFIYR